MSKEKKVKETEEKQETTETVEDNASEKIETAEEKQADEKETIDKKYDELYDKYLRMLAEYDNFKKRTQKEKDELYSLAVCETIEKFLPVIDNLERAILADAEKTPFYDGVNMVVKQIFEVLSKLDIEPIDAVGKEFNPLLHNAVMHIEDETKKDGEVVEQFAKGYRRKDKVIRYSMVKVAN